MTDRQNQTHVYDVLESEAQTEIPDYVTQFAQTPFPEMIDESVQSEPMEEIKIPSRISRAKKRIQQALGRDKELQGSQSAVPTLSGWVDPKEEDEEETADEEDEEEEEEEDEPSSERLDWNPVDGMHAEKQRPVRDLAKFFEVKSQRRRSRRQSKGRTQGSLSRSRGRAASLTPLKF